MPATIGIPARSPSALAAAAVRDPTTEPVSATGGTRSVASPVAPAWTGSGRTWPSDRVVRATPVRRKAAHSHALKYQRARAADAAS